MSGVTKNCDHFSPRVPKDPGGPFLSGSSGRSSGYGFDLSYFLLRNIACHSPDRLALNYGLDNQTGLDDIFRNLRVGAYLQYAMRIG